MSDYKTDIKKGLTSLEVQNRIINNKVNYDSSPPTKTILEIINTNLFTLFNLLNFGLAVAVILTGSYKNATFMGVVICNTLIGILQEINAKRITDKLSLISASTTTVIRDSLEKEIGLDNIVIDDLVKLKRGNQIICDAIILDGNCEVDESLITGESDPIFKKKGEKILSGSFIVSGNIKAQVINVGMDNYSAKITKEAKIMKNKKSELMYSLNKIIKLVSIVILPLGTILFLKQISIDNNSIEKAVINTVAALIGMIPEGLILLTSTVLAVSIIRLSRYKVLIQQLYSVETLARINTICLDKTGTLTDGKVEFVKYKEIKKINEIDLIISALVHNLDSNNTISTLKKHYNKKINWQVDKTIQFSSIRKWSGITFVNKGTYILGAPEFVIKNEYNKIKNIVDHYSKDYRVLILAKSNYSFKGNDLPKNIEPLGLILLQDGIRKEVSETLKYFKKQNVDIKIISGDNVLTVANIAKRLNVETKNKYIDASLLTTDEKLETAVLKYDIFGRVSPQQKKKMVEILQANNKVVGFVGDGVNDVLALKSSDCGIAMANGSDAAKNVSELILLDSNFAAMPHVVQEGRRTINNIERSATLFLVKTIYSMVLAILFLFINSPFPFEPIQLSLTSVFTIGIPSFILAIEPNNDEISGKFLTNVISKAMPTALTNVINVILIMIISKLLNFTFEQSSTLAVILSAFVGFMLLFKISTPFNTVRLGLMVFGISGFLIGVLGLPDLFSLSQITLTLWVVMLILMSVSIYNFNKLTTFYYKLKKKYPKYLD